MTTRLGGEARGGQQGTVGSWGPWSSGVRSWERDNRGTGRVRMGKLPEEKIILIYKEWNSWETSQIIEVGDRSEGLSSTGWSALIVVGMSSGV